MTIAVVACLLALGDMVSQHYDDEVGASPLAAPLFLVVTLPLLWRRAAPLASLAATLAGLLLHVALFGGLVRCGIIYPVGLLLGFAAGRELALRPALAGLGLVLALDLAVSVTEHETGAKVDAMLFVAPVSIAVWGIGRLVRSRGRMVDELAVRTTELREARDERARLEVATDRARLSAQLDALLQQRLAELAALAEAGAGGAEPSAALSEIEDRSRRTLEEMRALVSTMREGEAGAPLEPQPGLTQLEALVVRAKGAASRLTVQGRARPLPAGVELSAYRILEHLLEALDGDPVEVRVTFADDALEIAISGGARGRAQASLARARERVQMHGGTLRATTDGGRTEASVTLPVYAAV